MPTRQLTLSNKRGLHARAATKLVQCCQTYNAKVVVSHQGKEADAANIMSLMILAAPCGTVLDIHAEGDDAEQVLDALEALFEAKFEEEV
ncbi:HPr family phosphocarrier protein [Aidingimonas halophila]|uniref:Phosphocarrier protein NPr n=1 Tax=Aidingimonas halophila TaxID=574349 RepID=A0A1H2QZE5_9GAMM|nr:HPr family phosphocarrier protein [Aidingimonas halophila]GHC20042.1 phosphocarrier protein HPr [Aidingimonas halophila]SDW12543.1 phosphocarrier protein NPr [Aidingimonas halophila]